MSLFHIGRPKKLGFDGGGSSSSKNNNEIDPFASKERRQVGKQYLSHLSLYLRDYHKEVPRLGEGLLSQPQLVIPGTTLTILARGMPVS